MTEGEWNRCTQPDRMLTLLRKNSRAGERKLRLFASACCRSVWDLLADERSRTGVQAAEEDADNPGRLTERDAARLGAVYAMEDAAGDTESAKLGYAKWHAACAVYSCTAIPLALGTARDASDEARRAMSCYIFESAHPAAAMPFPEPGPVDGSLHANLLRDIFANPFRPPPTLPPALLTDDVLALARCAYENRNLPEGTLDPARLAALADALEAGGCTDSEVLGHLRLPGPHVRGCFAVDWILGRT